MSTSWRTLRSVTVGTFGHWLDISAWLDIAITNSTNPSSSPWSQSLSLSLPAGLDLFFHFSWLTFCSVISHRIFPWDESHWISKLPGADWLEPWQVFWTGEIHDSQAEPSCSEQVEVVGLVETSSFSNICQTSRTGQRRRNQTVNKYS